MFSFQKGGPYKTGTTKYEIHIFANQIFTFIQYNIM